MCTVVYIPNKNRCVFASLRDESPLRPKAIAPTHYKSVETRFIAPKDTLAGGTWLGAGESNKIIILLNGAFENHERKEFYAKSRGLIVIDLLSNLSPLIVWRNYQLSNIEPFTLIVWENDNLFQLVWDGQKKHTLPLDSTQAHIWSSSTLYNADARAQRQVWFNDWIKTEPEYSRSTLLNFFQSIPDSYNGFLMNRNHKVKTLSYTFMEIQESKTIRLDYHDFETNTMYSERLLFKDSILK